MAAAAEVAWRALFGVARLRAGQRILIHHAAGAVGAFAVQFARWAGAVVLATAAGEALETVLGLGAHKVIDTDVDRFEDIARGATGLGVDVVFVPGGLGDRALEVRSYAALRPGGVLVTLAPAPDRCDRWRAAADGVRARRVRPRSSAGRRARIAALIAAGQVVVPAAPSVAHSVVSPRP